MRFAIILHLLIFATWRLEAQEGATLRTGDTFELHVAGVPQEYAGEFALKYNLGQEGTINVPLIGEVKAFGLTPKQLEHAIQSKLVADGVFAHPTVVVDVSAANRIVAISGGVSSPQLLPWRPDLTLSSAITGCGGLTEFSSGKGIRVVRAGKILGPYGFKDLLKNPPKDPKLLPGDQVIVPD
jgi:polysaccharide export outer membrane protein